MPEDGQTTVAVVDVVMQAGDVLARWEQVTLPVPVGGEELAR